MSIKDDYITLIQAECSQAKVQADLFCAIVNAESAWDKDAVRFEDGYEYLWHPAKYAALNKVTQDTEIALQSMSWGLCQIMGANCRWLGYDRPLTNLLIPELNIRYGVLYFKRRCEVYPEIKDQISAWNMGAPTKDADGRYLNQDYIDRVYSYYVLKTQDT